MSGWLVSPDLLFLSSSLLVKVAHLLCVGSAHNGVCARPAYLAAVVNCRTLRLVSANSIFAKFGQIGQ
jgi:hypothetical protein